jgi:glycosyltransferase involved in cell wall biosynthesis
MPAVHVCVEDPLVTAVIPTRDRPGLLSKAVSSALCQDYPRIEIVVVVDGADPDTIQALKRFDDTRLRIIPVPEHVGGAEARNLGVRSAHGEWIAFLDDDDEWLPTKIKRQIKQAQSMREKFPILSSRTIAKTPKVEFLLPRRIYRPDQPIGDYLFCPESLSKGGGMMQTSTLLVSRELLLAVPFRQGLKMHQDWDWLIRAAAHDGVCFFMVPEPLAIFNVEDDRTSTGRSADWEFSLQWVRSVQEHISPHAYSSFIAVQCMWRAVKSGAGLKAHLTLLRALIFEGRVSVQSLRLFLAFWLVPERLRKLLRNLIWASRKRGVHMPAMHLNTSPIEMRASLKSEDKTDMTGELRREA